MPGTPAIGLGLSCPFSNLFLNRCIRGVCAGRGAQIVR